MTVAALGMRAMRAPDGTEVVRLWNGEDPNGIDLQPHNILWLIQALSERLHISTDGRATLQKVVDVSWEEFEGGRTAAQLDADNDALANTLEEILSEAGVAVTLEDMIGVAAELQVAGYRKV